MAEEYKELKTIGSGISIKKCAEGFLVTGSQYGGDDLRAFSTPEGLIEWLSRELGAGPIVWSLTLDVWAGVVEVKPEDLLPVPDHVTDPAGHQGAIAANALNLLDRCFEKFLKERAPKPPPKPKKKKAKKPKEEKPKKGVKEE